MKSSVFYSNNEKLMNFFLQMEKLKFVFLTTSWAIMIENDNVSSHEKHNISDRNRDLTFSVSNVHMMTSSNGDIFRVTGLLCGKFTGPRWIPLTKASDAELWFFLDLCFE